MRTSVFRLLRIDLVSRKAISDVDIDVQSVVAAEFSSKKRHNTLADRLAIAGPF